MTKIESVPKKARMLTLKQELATSAVVLIVYVASYVLNSWCGGYDPHWSSDGRRSHKGTLLMHDCILWQPRFGRYYNWHRCDSLGIVFYPLIRFDQAYVHSTRSIFDPDIGAWLESLSEADIHPDFREAFRKAKSKKPLEGAKPSVPGSPEQAPPPSTSDPTPAPAH